VVRTATTGADVTGGRDVTGGTLTGGDLAPGLAPGAAGGPATAGGGSGATTAFVSTLGVFGGNQWLTDPEWLGCSSVIGMYTIGLPICIDVISSRASASGSFESTGAAAALALRAAAAAG
jgi:hypothetical protein